VVVIEDADRLTENASNALLKAIEEPPERTVFLLCAPSTHPDDILLTVRSRCRLVTLRTPPATAVASVLVNAGVPAELADWAAGAAGGHVGRARRLATDPQARQRREAVLRIPARLTSVAACFEAAEDLVSAAAEEAKAITTALDAAETNELKLALGAGGTGKGTTAVARGTAGALRELERRQKTRSTRLQRDSLDRALVDLAAFYRDVLLVALGAASLSRSAGQPAGAGVGLAHPDFVTDVGRVADQLGGTGALRAIEAVLACRRAIEVNVKPRVAIEAMLLGVAVIG